MAALITLDDNIKEAFGRELNRLSFAMRNVGYGALFVAMIDGSSPALTEFERDRIYFALKRLNLDVYQEGLSQLLLDLVDSATQANAAKDVTELQKHEILRVLDKLNRKLAAIDFPQVLVQTVEALAGTAAATPGTGTTGGTTGGTTTPAPAPITLSTDLSASKTLWVGEKLTLAVVAAGGTAPLHYSWKKDGTTITGAPDAATYEFTTKAGDAGSYTVEITDSASAKPVISTAQVVQVNARPTVTAKAGATLEVEVGSTLDVSTLFTASSGTPTYSADASGNGTLAGSILTGAKAGDVVITATLTNAATTATATVTVKAKAAPAPKTFKVGSGTATVTGGNAVALTAADGVKNIKVTDSADAAVSGLAATLVTSGDSTKLAVAVDATDKKLVNLTPVAGQTGDVKVKIAASGYADLTITVTLS